MIPIALALLLAVPLPVWGVGALAPTGSPHPPIHIRSNSDLALPSSGVRSGSGTPEDPYRISDWTFHGLPHVGVPAILVEKTDVHIVIERNALHSTRVGVAIAVVHSRNVTVRDNLIDGDFSLGISASNASDVQIVDNEIIKATYGIMLSRVENYTVSHNTISCKENGLGYGLEFGETRNGIIAANSFTCRESLSMYGAGGGEISIKNNSVQDSLSGLRLYRVSPIEVVNNKFSSIRSSAMEFHKADHFTVEQNEINGTNSGVFLDVVGSGVNKFSGNRIDRSASPLKLASFAQPFSVEFSGNLIDGLPLLAYRNVSGIVSGAGIMASALLMIDTQDATISGWRFPLRMEHSLFLINCTRVAAEGNEFVQSGATARFGSNNRIENNGIRTYYRALQVFSPSTVIRGNFIESDSQGIEITTFTNELDQIASGSGAYIAENVVMSEGYSLNLREVENVLAENNELRGQAVRVLDAPGVTLRENAIPNGYVSATASKILTGWDVDARWNWWGAATGPAMTSGNVEVLYEPWLASPP